MSVPLSRRALTSVIAALTMVGGMVGAVVSVTPVTAGADPTPNAPTVTVGAQPQSSPTVQLSGSADAGSTVTVFEGNIPLGTTTATGGSWAVNVDLPPGTYNNLSAEETFQGATSAPAAAPQVTVQSNEVATNGSFEDPVVADCVDGGDGVGHCDGVWANYTSIPGWLPTNGYGIEIQTLQNGNVSSVPDGNQYVELNSDGVSGVVQQLATVPGTQYQVSFAYQARPGTQPYQNTMAVQWGGTYLAGDSTPGSCGEVVTPGSGLQGGSSWQVQTYTVTATSSTTPIEFDSTDPCSGDSVGDFLDNVQVVPLSSLLPSNTTWTTALPLSDNSTNTSSDPTTANPYALQQSGEGLWYEFPVLPGEQVQVTLSNVPADDNVDLFSDISQTFLAEQSSPPNGADLGAEDSASAFSASAFSASAFSASAFSASAFSASAFSASAFSASAFSASAFSASAFSASAFSASAFSASAFSASAFSSAYTNAQIDSLLAVSTTPGAVTKTVTADTWNDTGNFYIRVTGNNGATSPTPFTVGVTTTGGPCATYNPGTTGATGFSTFSGAGNGTALNGTDATPQTVIVWNKALMTNAYGATATGTLASDLTSLSNATGGVVVDVSQSPQVNDLVAQAQANPGCPYAENLEASDIQTIINSYRSNSLKYVVIVGDDDIIPFFRYADTAGLAPELDYWPPLATTSAADAALQNDYYLTDDPYGAATQLNIQGTPFPLANVAVGRLVETPADIMVTINNYLAPKGNVLTPTSSLESGYDFMAPMASLAAQDFKAGIPGDKDTELISNSWTASQLGTDLSTPQSLVFLGGHFSANNLLAGDDSTTLNTNQFLTDAGTNQNLKGSLVLGPGCHAGYTIDPADGIAGVTDGLSWPQAFAEAGATLIGGTGYQYGDSNYVAYSDQLYVDLAQQLGEVPTGSSSVAVGTALLSAKLQYLSTLFQLNGIELKALLQVTLYGLPMLGVAEPGAKTVGNGSGSSIVGTNGGPSSPTAVGTGPGAGLGLSTSSYNYVPTGLTQSVGIKQGNTTYSYYTFGNTPDPQLTAVPGGPVLPVQTFDVNYPNNTLRGVGFMSGTYSDTPGQNPLTGDPATDTSGAITPFSSPVFYPQTNWNPNYYNAVINGGDTELAVTPLQYESDQNGDGADTMRTNSQLSLQLFYDSNSTTGNAALAAAPSISNVTSTTNGDTVNVSATVTGDQSAGIQQVWVTYTDNSSGPLYGTWQSVQLGPSGVPNVWTGSYTDAANNVTGNPSSDSLFMVQAANGVGEVSLDNNYGSYFTPDFTPGQASNVSLNSYTLALQSPPSSGTYLGSTTVSAMLTPNGAGHAANQPITFSLGGANVSVNTNSSGIATATIPLYQAPGNYSVSASFAGDPADAPTSSTASAFVINPAGTSLTLVNTGSSRLLSGETNGLKATLTAMGPNNTNVPLSQKPVYFEVTNAASAVVGTGVSITNAQGVAVPGPITFSGSGNGFNVTAVFGSSSVTLPGGSLYNASDPDFTASTSSPLPVSTGFTQTITGSQNKSLTISSGQLVLVTGSLNGSISISKGGGLEVQGGTVIGSISASGAVDLTFCGATINGSVSATGSTGFVFAGGPNGTGNGCAASKIGGSISLSGNTAGVELIGSTVGGSMSVSNNTGAGPQGQGPEIAGNKIGGSLACSGNTPAPTDAGLANTLGGSRSGQCATPKNF